MSSSNLVNSESLINECFIRQHVKRYILMFNENAPLTQDRIDTQVILSIHVSSSGVYIEDLT